MANHKTLGSLFTAIANSLRSKTGGTGSIVADDFPAVIDSLSTGGITPTGTKTITANGTHDVSSFASAAVNVPTGGSENFHIFPITLSETGGAAAAMPTILSGNDFVKANYAKEGFFAMLIPLNAADSVQAANTTPFIYHGNRAIVNSKATVYGVRTNGNGSSSYATALCHTSKISASGYVVCLRANSSGNIILYVAANYKVPAGNYLLALGLAE